MNVERAASWNSRTYYEVNETSWLIFHLHREHLLSSFGINFNFKLRSANKFYDITSHDNKLRKFRTKVDWFEEVEKRAEWQTDKCQVWKILEKSRGKCRKSVSIFIWISKTFTRPAIKNYIIKLEFPKILSTNESNFKEHNNRICNFQAFTFNSNLKFYSYFCF